MSRKWIIDALGGEPLFDRLARRVSGTALWSALMEVVRERARARTPAQVLAQYERDGFVRPAAIDQRTLRALELELLAAAAAFEAIELSPVTPLGTCSSVALTDQHRVLSALRATEVVSDPTNVLALECAARVRRDPEAVPKLATCQRAIRAQQVPKQPGFAQHFGIFVLATAGREQAQHRFTVEALAEHVHTMHRALDRLEQRGYAFGERRLELLASPRHAALGDRLAQALSSMRPTRKPLEHPYYSGGVRYMLWVTDPRGDEVALIDGGAFDWLSRLTTNRRHVFVASGMGAQLAAARFRAAAG